jgi:electron transfer flavoprotein alpha/beta subunit
MSLEIFVILKLGFTIDGRARISRDGKSVKPECLSPQPQLADIVALEHALKLRERELASRVICVSQGAEAADEILSRGLGMGADQAIRLAADDGVFVDPQIQGHRIASVISGVGGKLVFTGGGSGDGDDEIVPHVVAADLGAACLSNVMDFELSGDRLKVERRVEKGDRQIWEADLPAVLAFDSSSLPPRYVATAMRILAQSRKIPVTSPDRPDPAAPTNLKKFVVPRIRAKRLSAGPADFSADQRMQFSVAGGLSKKTPGKVLSGPPDQVADGIVAFLDAKGLLGEPQ